MRAMLSMRLGRMSGGYVGKCARSTARFRHVETFLVVVRMQKSMEAHCSWVFPRQYFSSGSGIQTSWTAPGTLLPPGSWTKSDGWSSSRLSPGRGFWARATKQSAAAAASFRGQGEDFMARLSPNARLSDPMAGSHDLSCAAGALTEGFRPDQYGARNPEAISQRDSAPPIGFLTITRLVAADSV